jgi:hypothetical protein
MEMKNIISKKIYRQHIFGCCGLIFYFSVYINLPAQLFVKTDVHKIHGSKQINSYRILDTIRLKDTTIFIDKVVQWTSKTSNYFQPNFLGKTLMTPVAWGVDRGGMLFAGLGGSFPQIFSSLPDLIFNAGISIGNASKIGGMLMVNVNDVSQFNTLSGNIILNKHLSHGDAISAGGIHLFRSKLSDAGPSYYIVYSRSVQTIAFKISDASAFHYSVGIGTGRFYTKSPADDLLGHGKSGTAIFANASYQLFKWMNVNAEWSGINLHAGVSVKPFYRLPYITMGIGDITRFSGDRLRFLVRVGYSYYLRK